VGASSPNLPPVSPLPPYSHAPASDQGRGGMRLMSLLDCDVLPPSTSCRGAGGSSNAFTPACTNQPVTACARMRVCVCALVHTRVLLTWRRSMTNVRRLPLHVSLRPRLSCEMPLLSVTVLVQPDACVLLSFVANISPSSSSSSPSSVLPLQSHPPPHLCVTSPSSPLSKPTSLPTSASPSTAAGVLVV
jgi:hypothetical protein